MSNSRRPALKWLLAATLATLSGTLSGAAAIAAEKPPLRAAVAANMQYAFADLISAWQQRGGVRIDASYSASGTLVTQIRNGAGFDLFLSADMQYPQALHADGLSAGAVHHYASGALVLWTLKPDLPLNWPATLTQPGVRHIAIANPDTAPYGREAIRALQHAQLLPQLQARLVTGESISQVNQFITTGAADVGFTAKSIVLAPATQGKGRWLDVPATAYQPIAQGAVVLRSTDERQAQAQAFLDWLASAEARAIFARHGYSQP